MAGLQVPSKLRILIHPITYVSHCRLLSLPNQSVPFLSPSPTCAGKETYSPKYKLEQMATDPALHHHLPLTLVCKTHSWQKKAHIFSSNTSRNNQMSMDSNSLPLDRSDHLQKRIMPQLPQEMVWRLTNNSYCFCKISISSMTFGFGLVPVPVPGGAPLTALFRVSCT